MDSEERMEEATVAPAKKECVYKTKMIQFLGRTTPIILQNDNGPCPLLAICNVLLLRNNLNLNSDTVEVSQEKLLSLVAERLIDSNSNVKDRDACYAENQQQNISDAIDLLPRLATGIDVNIKFRRIDDFEFTPECAIFDLLDIALYHGWIVDPQDNDTANAIGSKSYNALMGELVALETLDIRIEHKNNTEEDSVDFVAATTATLGVPSPCLTRGKSFDESPCSDSNHQKCRKGDIEEEAELSRVLQLSEVETPTSIDNSLLSNTGGPSARVYSDEQNTGKFVKNQQPESSLLDDISDLRNDLSDLKLCQSISNESVGSSSMTGNSNGSNRLTEKSAEGSLHDNVIGEETVDTFFHDGKDHLLLHRRDTASVTEADKEQSRPLSPFGVDIYQQSDKMSAGDAAGFSVFSDRNVDPDSSSGRGQHGDLLVTLSSEPNVDPDSSSGRRQQKDVPETLSVQPNVEPDSTHGREQQEDVPETFSVQPNVHSDSSSNREQQEDVSEAISVQPNVDADSSSSREKLEDVPETLSSSADCSEPIYEGEECILDSGTTIYEGSEPVYEGEVVLAEQAGRDSTDARILSSADKITSQQGELIRTFLKNTANQLTVNGLFCLQDGLKERELCVFFRNNHFGTMFKIDGELYLLATDQGYINQPDLVWEKLNEVNGDTLYMTGSFKEFKVESHIDGPWDERNAMANTADYLASIDQSAGSNANSDLQLAIALQQQEFEQQPQRPVLQQQQQPSATIASRLVTGPQVPKSSSKNSSSSSSSSSSVTGKYKERCIVM